MGTDIKTTKKISAPLGVLIALLWCAIFSMQTFGLVHAVLHNHHAHHTSPKFSKSSVFALSHEADGGHATHTDPLGHDKTSLACLAWDAITTAAAPLAVWPLQALLWLGAFFVEQACLGLHLAFLLLHPPLARAPPWF